MNLWFYFHGVSIKLYALAGDVVILPCRCSSKGLTMTADASLG